MLLSSLFLFEFGVDLDLDPFLLEIFFLIFMILPLSREFDLCFSTILVSGILAWLAFFVNFDFFESDAFNCSNSFRLTLDDPSPLDIFTIEVDLACFKQLLDKFLFGNSPNYKS